MIPKAAQGRPAFIESPAYLADESGRHPFNESHLFRFPNGWGASVVRGAWTHGGPALWELAVLNRKGRLDYEHPVSEGDVRGHLSEGEVARLLAEIAASSEAP